MIALKPVLSAWLDEAEAAKRDPDSLGGGVLPPGEKKRKRTSIAAPEKRSLEAYFAVQPRPSGEKASDVDFHAGNIAFHKGMVAGHFEDCTTTGGE